MTPHDQVDHQTQTRGSLKQVFFALFVLCILFLPVYWLSAFQFSKGVDLLATPGNALFDMDTGRVIIDWTGWEESDRARTHPLYKYLALVGIPVHEVIFGGESPQDAARILCILGIFLQAILAGLLAFQLTRGSVTAAACVSAVCLISFPSLLLASIPDTAAIAGIFAILPFNLYYLFRGKKFTWYEMASWLFVGIFSFGITVSQVSFFFIAGAFRLYEWHDRKNEGLTGRSFWQPLIVKASVCVLTLVVAIWLTMFVQTAIFGGSIKHIKVTKTIEKELKFFETDELQREPHRRVTRLAGQFVLFNFASPEPVISYWSPPREDRQFLSITLVEKSLLSWPWWLWPFLAIQILLYVIWWKRAAMLKWYLPIVLGLLGQFCLHSVYGREFVIYGLNWHFLFVSLLLGSFSDNTWGRRWMGTFVGVYVVYLAASNLYVLDRVFQIYLTEFPVQEAFSIIEMPE